MKLIHRVTQEFLFRWDNRGGAVETTIQARKLTKRRLYQNALIIGRADRPNLVAIDYYPNIVVIARSEHP
uniref:Uncharacterized protein n=1 Tax=Romanomermis culicivorax TaxID=13658 RepID=A0A915L4E0_ROMCU